MNISDFFCRTVAIVGELRAVNQCSSAQRCILMFLFVLYQASHDMRVSTIGAMKTVWHVKK